MPPRSRSDQAAELLVGVIVVSLLGWGFVQLWNLLGAGIASVTAGWLASSVATIHRLWRMGLSSSSRRGYMIYGVWLIFIALVAVVLVGVMGADLRLGIEQTIEATRGQDRPALEAKALRIEALLDGLKNFFIMVSAALGASALFAAMTLPRESPAA